MKALERLGLLIAPTPTNYTTAKIPRTKKGQKKFLAMLSIVLVALAVLSSVAVASVVSTSKVVVTMMSQNPDPVQPGRYVEVRWKVENKGGSPTNEFLFELMPQFPFSLDPGVESIQQLGKVDSYQIGPDAYVVYYKLRVDENAVAGENTIKYRYSPNGGTNWVEKTSIIKIEESEVILVVDEVLTKPARAQPGQTVDLQITFENLAMTELRDVKVTLNLERIEGSGAATIRSELPFSPLGTTNEKIIKRIEAGKKATVGVTLAVESSAASKVHKVPVTVTYKNAKGQTLSKEFKVGISVFQEPSYIVHLENTEIYKNKQKGRVVISIANTGTTQLNFLIATLLPSEDYTILSPAKTYIGNLVSDDFETMSFDIYVDSQKNEIPLRLKLTYSDEYNKQYEVQVTGISIPLYEQEKALLYGFEKPESKTGMIVLLIVGILLTVFWLFTLGEAIAANHPPFKKVVWIITILLTFAIGAFVYHFFGRNKER
ncbi:MAG: hypothetical protein QW594_01655 [Candidatus Woesearchaeota archaeon]